MTPPSVWLDIPDFLAREETQRIKRMGITLMDFAEMHRSLMFYRTVASERRTLVGQVILGLKGLEEVYVLGGDEARRLFLPLEAQKRMRMKAQKGGLRGLGGRLGAGGVSILRGVLGRRRRRGNVGENGEGESGDMGLEKWTGEIEFVGEGEGMFPKFDAIYAGYGNLISSHRSITGIEECWESMVEVEKSNKGRDEWRAPRVVGREVNVKRDEMSCFE